MDSWDVVLMDGGLAGEFHSPEARRGGKKFDAHTLSLVPGIALRPGGAVKGPESRFAGAIHNPASAIDLTSVRHQFPRQNCDLEVTRPNNLRQNRPNA